jgi:peroxisome-assembly ATPase
MPVVPSSPGLTITDPIVAYRTLLALKQIRPDPAQHRLALQLQKLYYRLKDYNPELEYRHRLDEITRNIPPASHIISQNGSKQRRANTGLFASLGWSRSQDPSTLALTRTIPIQDSAISIQSPRGMLLYGEVGRGKSMLLDLLANSLPSGKKKRWHFNTFMLEIFRRLESLRNQRLNLPPHLQGLEQEHSVLSLAKDTISTSPILFLDEFQMPDRAASKLLNNFMTSFFHLGGVLIATSNRMPEELAKAAGVEFAPPPGSASGLFGWRRRQTEAQRAAVSDFGQFLEVLKARCEVWEMEGERDWRREDGQLVEDEISEDREGLSHLPNSPGTGIAPLATEKAVSDTTPKSSQAPPHYHVFFPPSLSCSATAEAEWLAEVNALTSAASAAPSSHQWSPATLHVYGRRIAVPASTPSGITMWTFSQLCAANLGPADYITLASTYHTLILTDVPVLTTLLKNEARRFITLLDALYESKCKLLIRAQAPPDQLFFPETRKRAGVAIEGDSGRDESSESVYQETYSEIYQDSTAPFRPNISVYAEGQASATPSRSFSHSQTLQLRSVLADEDADFGPVYGNGRGHGASMGDAGFAALERRKGPDFRQASKALTGEDERFAYKRARSRLWEMCGERWWRAREGRDIGEWWRPVRREWRHWEGTSEKEEEKGGREMSVDGLMPDGSHDGRYRKADRGLVNEKEESLFRHGASPFRTRADPPPTFGWQHAWGMMTWGRKAGEWGKGVDGDKNKDRRKE